MMMMMKSVMRLQGTHAHKGWRWYDEAEEHVGQGGVLLEIVKVLRDPQLEEIVDPTERACHMHH
jgi:hypothetical protein